MKIKIRHIKKSDLPELAEVYVLAYTKLNIGEHWTPATARKLLAYWLKKQPDLALTAEVDGKLVGGFLSGIKPWWDGNHLADGELFVHPDYQKRGIGIKLSIALYRKALKKYKAVAFDAFTFKKKKFPLNWYLRQGFVQNSEWTMITGNVKKILTKLESK